MTIRCLRSSGSANRSARPSASSCRCSALVKVDTHTVPPRALGPQRRRREIGQRLADPRPRLGEQHVGLARRPARREDRRRLARHRPLPLARLGPRAGQLGQLAPRASAAGIDMRLRRRPLGRLLPLRQAREQHPLAALGLAPAAGRRTAPSPSRAGTASHSTVHAPSRSGQSASASVAEQRLGDRDQRRAPPRHRSPAARLPPRAPAPPRSAPRTAPDGRRRTARAGRARDTSG